MRSLDLARAACETHQPGLCAALAEIPLLDRESAGSPVIDLFRKHNGIGLLVPRAYAGAGVDAVEAVRVLRGLASYSPSLGAAVTMHHFTAAMLFALAADADRLTATQLQLLSRIVPDRLLLASGWAEGRPNQNILSPSLAAVPSGDGGWLLTGGKKPCSLSGSMDLLTASVALTERGESSLAVALVPADAPGVSVHPFWASSVLAAAESDEVRLADVRVADDLIIRTMPDDPHRLDDLQAGGFVWFVLLISSVYTGVASELADRVLRANRGTATDRATVAIGVESAVSLLEGTARAVRDGLAGDDAVAAVLVARYAAQQALAQATDLAVELLGGMAFIGSSEIAYLSSAVRAIAFHPPARGAAAGPLLEYFAGGPLVLS